MNQNSERKGRCLHRLSQRLVANREDRLLLMMMIIINDDDAGQARIEQNRYRTNTFAQLLNCIYTRIKRVFFQTWRFSESLWLRPPLHGLAWQPTKKKHHNEHCRKSPFVKVLRAPCTQECCNQSFACITVVVSHICWAFRPKETQSLHMILESIYTICYQLRTKNCCLGQFACVKVPVFFRLRKKP